ncbi:MAG TPA: restriction endonuclease [Bacillota bacterium]|nr:restriction endonuclease [Bacillota bacterium]
MPWLTEEDIVASFVGLSFDIGATHNGRWIDQKCTPDVLCIVADCIENYVAAHGNQPFSSVDVWHDEYTTTNVEQIFSKPGLTLGTSRNEYDKFFQQPMEMFAASGVLQKTKRGNRNFYAVCNADVLSYIAMRERNALSYVQLYIEKVLTDSGLMTAFADFFRLQTPEAYTMVKTQFENFTIANTPINGRTECRRIFTKVINPLAFKRRSTGTEKGRLSLHPITYDMLMYNRDNFRDLYSEKPKGMTRSEYAIQVGAAPNPNYYIYLANRAKRFLREFNDRYRNGRSEVMVGADTTSPAIHMHHIFPEARYPEISAYLENLIALSPTQHLSYAHPMGNTQTVDSEYQHICLVAKSSTIQENLNGPEDCIIYEFARFLFVLNVGFSTDEFEEVEDLDFEGVVTKINLKYA